MIFILAGVDVRPKASVKAVRFDDGTQKVVLTLDNGQTVSNFI